MSHLEAVLRVAALFHETRLDQVEVAAMRQFVLLRSGELPVAVHYVDFPLQLAATQLQPTQLDLRRFINAIFEALRRHYDRNFEDIATRLGALMLLIEEVQVLRLGSGVNGSN